MIVHDFSHYNWCDLDPDEPATQEFCNQLDEVSNCWTEILTVEAERNPEFRAYFGTLLMLCEGQAWQ